MVTRSLKLKADCGEQIGLSTGLRDENTKLDKEVKMKSQELLKLHSEGKSVNKIRDALIKRNKQLEAQKLEIEGQRKQGKLENELYHGGTEKIRRQIEMYKKEFEDFEREKLIIDANLTKTIAATQTNLQLQLPYKQTKENLDLEISRFQKEIMVNERTLRQILLERDMYIKDAAVLQTQCVEGLQEIKKKELLVYLK